jgi:hypothetical protein
MPRKTDASLDARRRLGMVLRAACLLCLTCAGGTAARAQSQNVTTQQLTLTPQNSVPLVNSVQITPSVQGGTVYYYWFVSHSGGVTSPPAGPFPSPPAPATLGGINTITVTWTPVPTIATYDVLRTTTTTVPSGACSCAVATATIATVLVDNLASTSVYAVATSASQLPGILTNTSASLGPFQYVAPGGNIAAAISAFPPGTCGTVVLAPGTYSISSTVQLPINGSVIGCIIEGSGIGSPSGGPQRNNTLIVCSQSSGACFNQVQTNSAFQNSGGSLFRNLTIDGSSACANCVGVDFGGEEGYRFENATIQNFGLYDVETENASGMFTERYSSSNLELRNGGTALWAFVCDSGCSSSFEHGDVGANVDIFNGENGFLLSGNGTLGNGSDFHLNGNCNSTGTLFAMTGSTPTITGLHLISMLEADSACVFANVPSGDTFSAWGVIRSGGFTNTIAGTTGISLATSSSEWSFTGFEGSTAVFNGDTMIASGTVTLSSGSGSHPFGTPYGTAPHCTATDTTAVAAVKAVSSTTAITLTGTGSDVITWTCIPANN